MGEGLDAADGWMAQCFRTVLDDLVTISRNRIQPKLDRALLLEADAPDRPAGTGLQVARSQPRTYPV